MPTPVERGFIVKRLYVEGFRGIGRLELEDVGLVNVIVGRNGTGKSSLLEAVALIASAPGFLDIAGVNLLEWVAWRRGRPVSTVLATLVRAGNEVSMLEAGLEMGA